MAQEGLTRGGRGVIVERRRLEIADGMQQPINRLPFHRAPGEAGRQP